MNQNSALGAIKRRWWIILLLAVIGGVIGAIPEPQTVEQRATSYTATHTLLLNDNTAVQTGQSVVSPEQVPLFATTGDVPARAAEAIGYTGNPAELASQVQVSFDYSTGALLISTTQDTGPQAEEIADAFAVALTGYLAQRQDAVYQERLTSAVARLDELELQLDDLTRRLAASPEDSALLAQRDAVARQYGYAFESFQTLDQAPPVLGFTTLQSAQAVENIDAGLSAPTSRRSRAVMGVVLGGALGVAVAFLLGQLDRAMRSRDQAEDAMNLRARALIPKSRSDDRDGLVVVAGRHEPLADAYRTVRNVVGFVHSGLDLGGRAPVTLVVSPGPGDGKTSLAANLAAAFAETGRRTIAVNTDFRRPRLAKAVNGSDVLHPFLADDLPALQTRTLLTKTSVPGLVLLDLSSIEATPGDLARATSGRIPDLADVADVVVIDSSPVGATAEVLDFVPYADVIVVVARLGHTSLKAAERTAAILRDLTTAPTVLVLTGAKIERTAYYEYHDKRRDGVQRSSRWNRKRTKPDSGAPASPPTTPLNAPMGAGAAAPADGPPVAAPSTTSLSTPSAPSPLTSAEQTDPVDSRP